LRIAAIDIDILEIVNRFRVWAVEQFVGSTVLPATGKCPYQPLVIGFALQVGGCGRFWSVYAVEDRQS